MTAATGGLGYLAVTQYTGLKDAKKTASECTSRLAGHSQENATLRKQVADLTGARESLARVKGTLTATQTELEQLRAQKAETAKRLAAFREITAQFKKMIDTGKLEVAIRSGQMVLKLPASVLFPSGSAELSRDGEMALMEVAIILRQFKERKFMIAGHTDNLPLENTAATVKYSNNWELSAGRAVTVTQFLIEARMDPRLIVAAGYGEFDPIGNNATVAGRQENRRIEIVLLPNIDELPVVDE